METKQISIWNKEMIDHEHFSWDFIFGYQKTWNFVIGERESGKSANSWMKIFNVFYYRGQPSLVIRRRAADITSVYLEDTEKVLNKFLLPEHQIHLYFLKGDMDRGVGDVRIGSASEYLTSQAKIKALPVFFRVAALATPMSRLKSNVLINCAYFFFDEFIANTRQSEKYLEGDEHFLIKEIYTTYNREAKKPIRIIAAGNPYSIYNPIFSALGVNSNLLKPGAFISQNDYCIDCFQVSEELKAIILAKNPMYQFDETYKRYAFGGEAINDANIRLWKTEPKGFKLRWAFKIGSDYLSIHQGSGEFKGEPATFWACKHRDGWIEKLSPKRKIIVFNYGDLIKNAVRFENKDFITFMSLKQAMNHRKVIYNTVDAEYMLEDILDAQSR